MAYAKGLIPYVPGENPSQDISTLGNGSLQKASQKTDSSPQKALKTSSEALYVFAAFIVGGPISEKFAAKNPVVAQTIEIESRQAFEWQVS